MVLNKPISVKEIASLIGAKLLGNDELQVTGLNEIHKVVSGDITFVDHPKYYDKSLQSAATVIIIDKEVEVPQGKCLLVVEAPFDAYDSLAQRFLPHYTIETAISKDIPIGKKTIIEPNVTISPSARIGNDCYIEAGVYIGPHTVIKNKVHIGPNTTIGSDAFYYKKSDNNYTKWHNVGRVVLEDDVDIGANCTINRGVSGDTIIGRGTKLDCLIHIAHGVVIGEDCLLAAQTGISGKTIIGDRCTIYGQVGITQNVTIPNDVTLLAKSGVSKDLKPNQIYFGAPCKPVKEAYKEMAAIRMLPEFMKKNR